MTDKLRQTKLNAISWKDPYAGETRQSMNGLMEPFQF